MEFFICLIGNQDTARHAQRFNPGSKINTIAEYMLIIKNDITNMQSHPYRDPGYLQEFLLHGQRALHRFHYTLKSAERSISIKLNDAAMILFMFALNNLTV